MNNEHTPNIYFTSDWHLFHTNVLKFDNRPFQDIHHMHRVLINNYNSTVSEGDICYFLGDMGMCKPNKMEPIISQLKGIKILILGNHDKSKNAMLRIGFHAILNGAVLEIANKRVTLSHCPLQGVFREDVTEMKGSKPGEMWHGEARHARRFSWSEVDSDFHLHGHVHSSPEEKILGRQFDVGVKANDYNPVSIRTIESWIGKYRKG